MQGADSNVMECKETVDAFMCKVEYRKNRLAKGDLQQFPLLMEQSRREGTGCFGQTVHPPHGVASEGDALAFLGC